LRAVESALRGGARVIQYRDKPATENERLRNAKNLQALCTDYKACFIINDDLNLCLRVEADGVHLGKSDGDISDARKQLGYDKLLGVTCHNDLVYAQHCIDSGVNYCAFGRIFPSKTKANAPHCAMNVLKQASKLACSSVAIGGITTHNVQQIVDKQINSVAVIYGLFGQNDIESTARTFSALLEQGTK
jgi:thiamine-phosphate pyrophosphorylase